MGIKDSNILSGNDRHVAGLCQESGERHVLRRVTCEYVTKNHCLIADDRLQMLDT